MTGPGCKPPGMSREDWIAHLVATAPPLTDDQLDRLRRLLPPVQQPVETAASGAGAT